MHSNSEKFFDYHCIPLKTSTNDTAVVAFSGGLDSTLSLIYAVLNYKKVECISIFNDQLPANKQQECNRQKILKVFNDNRGSAISKMVAVYPEISQREIELICSTKRSSRLTDFITENSNPTQALFWATHMPVYLKSNQDFIFGYIKHDVFWHFKPEIMNIINSTLAFKGATNVNIVFPFAWVSKAQIVKAINEFNPELLKYCLFCDHPKEYQDYFVNCGTCSKCREVKHQIDDDTIYRLLNIWSSSLDKLNDEYQCNDFAEEMKLMTLDFTITDTQLRKQLLFDNFKKYKKDLITEEYTNHFNSLSNETIDDIWKELEEYQKRNKVEGSPNDIVARSTITVSEVCKKIEELEKGEN